MHLFNTHPIQNCSGYYLIIQLSHRSTEVHEVWLQVPTYNLLIIDVDLKWWKAESMPCFHFCFVEPSHKFYNGQLHSACRQSTGQLSHLQERGAHWTAALQASSQASSRFVFRAARNNIGTSQRLKNLCPSHTRKVGEVGGPGRVHSSLGFCPADLESQWARWGEGKWTNSLCSSYEHRVPCALE